MYATRGSVVSSAGRATVPVGGRDRPGLQGGLLVFGGDPQPVEPRGTGLCLCWRAGEQQREHRQQLRRGLPPRTTKRHRGSHPRAAIRWRRMKQPPSTRPRLVPRASSTRRVWSPRTRRKRGRGPATRYATQDRHQERDDLHSSPMFAQSATRHGWRLWPTQIQSRSLSDARFAASACSGE